jgi:hypothetical protein
MTKRTRYFMLGSAGFLMIGLTGGLAAYYGGIPGLAQPAGPEELNYVPNDAVVVAYANVRQLMDSQFRQQVKELQPADQQKGQDEFRNATGINLETDIDYVLASVLPESAGSVAGDGKCGFVLARGRFDQPRIEALIREKGGVEQSYKGKQIFVHAMRGEPGATDTTPPAAEKEMPPQMGLAFLDAHVVALGTAPALQRVIDLQFGAKNVRANDELMKMIEGVDNGNAWAVGRFDVLSRQAHLPQQVTSQLPPITWFSATGHVDGGVSGTVSVEARDREAADNLRQVVAGFMALAKLQAGSKPELNGVLQSITIGGTDNTVAVSFTLPAGALEALKAAGMRHHEAMHNASPK